MQSMPFFRKLLSIVYFYKNSTAAVRHSNTMAFRTFITFLFLSIPLYGHAQFPDDSVIQEEETYVPDNSPPEEAVGPGNEEEYGDHTYQSILYPDTATVSQPVSIDRKSWNSLTDDRAFHYIQEQTHTNMPDPVEKSWLVRMLESVMNFLSHQGSWIIWVLVGGIVLFVLYKILHYLQLDSKHITRAATAADLAAECPAADLENLISQSLSAHRIADAISYMYQHIILLMQQRSVINIRQETTNSEILRMTRSLSYYSELKTLISRFEYVWFGEYPVSEAQFEQYHRTYQSLRQHLT